MHRLLVQFIKVITMIVAPVALVILEWNHPSGFSKDVYSGLSHMASWWTVLHIIQSFLFGLVSIGAILLTIQSQNIFGILSKFFIWLFAVSYLVFDSTAGISVGFVLNLPVTYPDINWNLETIKEVAQKLYNDKIIGGSGSFFSLLGSYSWLIGIFLAVISIFIENKKMSLLKLVPPLMLLLVSAYSLFVGHYSPYGPVAFISFAVASLWMEIFRFKY